MMKFKLSARSLQLAVSKQARRFRPLSATNYKLQAGFSLIETLVAVTLLSVAIVAPMTLASKGLASAYYARDQITAFYLAQDAIEAVRGIRDGQILQIAKSPTASTIDIFGPIPVNDVPFTIDTRNQYSASPPLCAGGPAPSYGCPPLRTDGTLYGYDSDWAATNFTRVVKAHFVKKADGVTDNPDEIRVTVTVIWKTGSIQARSFTISENMYRWVSDGVSQ